MAREKLCISVSSKTHNYLKKIAEEDEESKSRVVSDLIEKEAKSRKAGKGQDFEMEC
ncbi:hypothetical protein [Methanococcus maripaludis]|uniref:Uncharacterized protein n=1 Tax=Methanococcus maripaludis TaxID=39152 RepID=A0A7J9S2G9_METMI|nr:hypothetical protein [Methanococcus maripaludis]MBB6067890.1 hypothetical protein [Methanococcus maripaludis]MBM7408798.1 hypothetical protein [Methanococcus maripaludis]MBP2219033.1 hypothetical protein [Methanococcus maripaludis]